MWWYGLGSALSLMGCTVPVTASPTVVDTSDDAPSTETDPPETSSPDVLAESVAVVFNEVQTDNDATIMDADLVFRDWLELYNPADEPVALSRLSISDGNGERWTGGAGALGPGEHLLLWADLDLPFGLSVDGERLELWFDDVVIDRIATGEMGSDTAWARYPDGQHWAYTARATPGWTNGSHPGQSTDPSDALFQADTVLALEVWVSDAQWLALEEDHYTAVEASMGFGPAWFPQVGFRKKSTVGSNRDLSDKAAFKINLNTYGNHRLGGQEKLTLNNMVQDPTYVAEYLSYSLYRAAGIPAPRVGYVRLQLNGEDRGLYALIETVDENFLARWFADDSGVLYEGAYGTDLVASDLDDFEVDEGETDRSDLAAVAAVLDGPADDAGFAALEALVDMDAFVLNMAIEAGILHWDGYTTANNYRLYNNPRDGRFIMLPWGTDQTFISSDYPPYIGGGALMTFCMANADCRARYSDALREVADLMDSLPLQEDMNALRAMLADDIASDPLAEHSAATQDDYLSAMETCILECPDRLRAAAE